MARDTYTTSSDEKQIALRKPANCVLIFHCAGTIPKLNESCKSQSNHKRLDLRDAGAENAVNDPTVPEIGRRRLVEMINCFSE